MSMTTVESYYHDLNPAQKKVMKRVRSIIQKAAPNAVEGISYGMPVFKQDGAYLIGYAAFKDHCSVFPGPEAITSVADQLKDFTISKGTIQFTDAQPLPDAILKMLLEHRLQAIKNHT